MRIIKNVPHTNKKNNVVFLLDNAGLLVGSDSTPGVGWIKLIVVGTLLMSSQMFYVGHNPALSGNTSTGQHS